MGFGCRPISSLVCRRLIVERFVGCVVDVTEARVDKFQSETNERSAFRLLHDVRRKDHQLLRPWLCPFLINVRKHAPIRNVDLLQHVETSNVKVFRISAHQGTM